jgi:hypothetical protein
MKRVGTLVLCVVAAGIASFAPAAHAQPNWKVNGKFIGGKEEFVARTFGALKMTRTVKATGAIIKIVCVGEDFESIVEREDKITLLTFTKCSEEEVVGGKLERRENRAITLATPEPQTILESPYEDEIEFIKVYEFPSSFMSSTEIEGSLVGVWNNATATLEFPETPLPGTAMKTSEGEEVIVSGEDHFELEGGGTLEVGEEAQYGICAKANKEGKKYLGAYTDKNCTKPASAAERSEGKKNKYEWIPYPGPGGTNWSYTSKTKTVSLKGSAGEIKCKASTDVGEVTGTASDSDMITFTGCTLSVTGGACTSAGKPAGTIETGELDTKLVGNGKTRPSGKEPGSGEVWTEFVSKAGSEGVQAEFTCEPGIPFTVTGSLSGVQSGDVDAMSSKGKTTFSQAGGEQDLIATFFNPLTEKAESGPVAQTGVSEVKGKGKIEIKA